MTDFIEKDFIQYKRAKSNVQIDCYHNIAPKQEFYIEHITKEIATATNCSSILSNISRVVADLNRKITKDNIEAIHEYRECLKTNIKLNGNLEKPYLLIILHGFRDRGYKDIEIGTRKGTLASPEITKWFIDRVKQKFEGYKVVVDDEFLGAPILKHYKYGNEYFQGFGENLNIFQVELAASLRWNHKNKIIKNFAQIAHEFENEIVIADLTKKQPNID